MFFKRPFCYAVVLSLLSGCIHQSASEVRSWLDNQTAVTVTAQRHALVFSREDFAAGVNVRDYAELGCFEINQSGRRKLYVGLILWSTVNRAAAQLAEDDARFARIVLQADDRPIELQRVATSRPMLGVSTAIFSLPAPGAREAYYELTASQLAALAAARHVLLEPVSQPAEGAQTYKLWRGDLQEFTQLRSALHGDQP